MLFSPHTHTHRDIFWICQRFFVVFSIWIFQKRCEAASLGHKSIKCRHNTQRTQRATSTAAVAALPAAAAATWQAGVAAKRACGGGVTEEGTGRRTGCLACKESHWQESMQTFSIKNCSAICQLALPHLNVCTFACVCVWVCGCVCGVCTDVSVSLVLALVPVYLSNVANCLSITITVKH